MKERELKQIFLVLLFQLVFISPFVGADDLEEVRIGVLAKRGIQQCNEQWEPTAEYLTNKIPEYNFQIVPLDFEEIFDAVENEKVDFILANSSFSVELEVLNGINRIATLKNLRVGKGYTTFGGVIFYRSNRGDIQSIEDLKGKIFSAADENSFGGWQMAWRELKEEGIDPFHFFSDLHFPGTHDGVVYDVLDGSADAGTVRTDTLERMELEGKIALKDFSILSLTDTLPADFPFLLSTKLYPEWPIARVRHTDLRLSEMVSAALIEMKPGDHAAKIAQCEGWTVPLNYQSVHDCLKALKIGPYHDYGRISLMEVIRLYYPLIIGTVILFTVAILIALYVFNLNRKLGEAIKIRESELKRRKETEKELQSALDKIQTLLNDKTVDLIESGKALQDETALCHTLLHSIQAGVLLWDSNARIITLNPVAEQILGVSLQEIKGKSINEVPWSLIDESKEKVNIKDYPVSKVITTKEPVCDFVAGIPKPEEGNIIWIIANARALLGSEKILDRVLVVFMDITERRQTEEFLVQTEKMISIGRIAAGIAHEINNPLAGVIQIAATMARRLTDNKMPANQHAAEESGTTMEARGILHMIQMINESGHRTADIIGNLLSFSRKSDASFSSFQPADLMDSILELATTDFNLKKHYDFKSIKIEKIYEENLPVVSCERSKIQQVLLNILNNGAQAMYEYQKETSYVPRFILRLVREIKADLLRIEIEDNGPGMDDATRTRIFEPFFTTKPIGVGTGLGLYISYFIITRNHGGTLEVESEPGKGSKFIIRIPLER